MLNKSLKYTTIVSLLLASSQAGKCPFGYGGTDDEPKNESHSHTVSPRVEVANINYPNDYFVCGTTAATKTANISNTEY